MNGIHLGVVEARFADLIWDNEPISSGELVKLCERELSWKKSTVYTVLKKLCDRGIFVNKDGSVFSAMSKSEFNAKKTLKFVEETFNGSLPAFIAAFTNGKRISQKEADEIKAMIDAVGKDN